MHCANSGCMVDDTRQVTGTLTPGLQRRASVLEKSLPSLTNRIERRRPTGTIMNYRAGDHRGTCEDDRRSLRMTSRRRTDSLPMTFLLDANRQQWEKIL